MSTNSIDNDGVILTDVAKKILPNQMWFNREEVCELKGMNLETTRNHSHRFPNLNVPDGKLNGNDVWNWITVSEWLPLLDDEIEERKRQAKLRKVG